MLRTLTLAAAALLVALSAFAVACGDDNGDDPENGSASSPTPLPPNLTPFPTGQVTDNRLVSESKGYSATLPPDWRPRFNHLQTIDASSDAFFEPLVPGSAVQANVAVTCVVDSGLPTDQRIAAEQTTTARVGLNSEIQVSQATIDGAPATVISYVQTSQDNPSVPDLAKTDYLFDGAKCEYKLTTISTLENRAQYQPVFDGFISSFQYEK
jgi:hypothetical protein